MDQIILGIASALKLDANELIAELKEGEDWKEDAGEILKAKVSDQIKAVKTEQHGRGLSTYEKRLLEGAKSRGFQNTENLTGPELQAAIFDHLSAKPEGNGEPPKGLSKADLLKLPEVQEILGEKLKAASDQNEALKQELDGVKTQTARERKQEKVWAKIVETLEAEKAILETDSVPKDKRLATIRRLVDFDRMDVDDKGVPILLGDDGQPAKDDFGKPIPFKGYVMEVNPFGVHTVDPKKGGAQPQPGSNAPAGNGKISFASMDDYNRFIKKATDPKQIELATQWRIEQPE
jgi:hypothetical protein